MSELVVENKPVTMNVDAQGRVDISSKLTPTLLTVIIFLLTII